MFPVPAWIVVTTVIVGLSTGALAGAISGLVCSWSFRTKRRGLGLDALLGAAGYVAGWAIFFLLVARHYNHSPNPLLLSYGLAVLLPAIRQYYRRSGATPASGPEPET